MRDQVLEFINRIRADRNRVFGYDEAATKNGVILPLLKILGWDPFDPDEVRPEYTVETRRVDYSLAMGQSNKVFIEVKRPSEILEGHQEQLSDYAFHQGVELAILTNGTLFWFYLPSAHVTWRERRFYTIDIINAQDPNEVASKFVAILSKQNVASGSAIRECQRIHESKQKEVRVLKAVPEAWNTILSEPDSLLIDLLSEKTESLSGFKPDDSIVRKFLLDHLDRFSVEEFPIEPISPIAPRPDERPGTTPPVKLNRIEIELNRNFHTATKFRLIPLSIRTRHFFPGYRVPFILETDIGRIETKVTSAREGTRIGDPDAGAYIQGGLGRWFRHHRNLRQGSVLIIEALEKGKRYKLSVR